MVNGDHVCGAGIIGREWGITAAHCVIEFIDSPYNFVSVRSGSNRHDYGGIVHNVTYMSYHEKYDSGNNDYDIAVFKVDPFFRFNNVTQPANLPENSRFYDTDWGLVAGWGDFIDFDPVLSNNLQYVIVPKVCRKLCAEDYRNRYEITDRQVCYGFQDGGKDSCKGDSGGPLVTKNFTMIGITSWGDDCGKPNSPGVYTDVIGLVDWVKNKTTV
ncbi:PREDICTED: vitellin-degrading protease-like [Dufourea novaeangliae]|uniref:Trypsin-7 n=1 Tax=Dufourea novaeangliae TaxID=178035 RepID=A0A154PF44_DUFNO|nr:PREDICTED: vitellin-degrading protease-like [Dufourea novaeangliae]KZC10506.1 Trypsin-7 [Dufourea novaeangliae]